MSVSLQFLGHSGFIIDDGRFRVAIDPFLTGNPVAAMKSEDVVVSAIALTHGHADHAGDAYGIAERNGAVIYSAFELAEYFQEMGHAACEPMNPGGRVEAPFGWVALTPAFHSSSLEGRYMGQPCGVLLNIGGVTIYHCGDTALFSDMKLIGEIYQPDVACIPIGDRFTMGPELATRAAELIKPKVAIPIHYNTWPPIEQDPSNFKPTGIAVKIMNSGDSWSID